MKSHVLNAEAERPPANNILPAGQSRSIPAGWSIKEWCARWHISPALYFKLQRQGKGPKTLSINRLKRITPEADDQWRRAREAAAE
jgi:hypothetical protein